MYLRSLGNASLLISNGKDEILVDPYMKSLPKGYETEEERTARRAEFLLAENVLITHGHFDHLGSICELYAETNAQIYLSATPYKTLIRKGFDKSRLHIVSPGDKLSFGGISVGVHKGRHVRYDARLLLEILFSWRTYRHFFRMILLAVTHLGYPEKGETLAFEVTNGKERGVVLGSASLADTYDGLMYADFLVLPNQGRSDINRYNVGITSSLLPRAVYIDHHDDSFPPLSRKIDSTEYIEIMKQKMPNVAVKILKEGMSVCTSEM